MADSAAVHPKFLTHDLNPAQREAVEATVGPLCILAGAGTGKTRVISRRVAYAIATGAVHPGHVLVVTFTDKAANEMRERLAALGFPGVQAQTFHAAAFRQLRYFWSRLSDSRLPDVLGLQGPGAGAAPAQPPRRLQVHRHQGPRRRAGMGQGAAPRPLHLPGGRRGHGPDPADPR